ncbi:hypothetical protein ODU73_001910 [Thermoclostridium stercorarium]|uniref:hypothetical protein n=1 Tax=Thermoclostridium stercorarium TaxID=1510 RepID=UPI0002C5AED8|nr:hypothetical protein [Thermoclostridium stercorarium]AGI39850.1 hypothetical protein Clst_1803 [Thermoclostridium stercorarium subsp. stercorarium DSM 8532]UZQ84844.1 hypothetical protein ODU73_001910 [Thermoclostridium stercorarium]
MDKLKNIGEKGAIEQMGRKQKILSSGDITGIEYFLHSVIQAYVLERIVTTESDLFPKRRISDWC